jgi:hypothetical protein
VDLLPASRQPFRADGDGGLLPQAAEDAAKGDEPAPPDGKTGEPRIVAVVDTSRPYIEVLPFTVSYRLPSDWKVKGASCGHGAPPGPRSAPRHRKLLRRGKRANVRTIAHRPGYSMPTLRRLVHLLPGAKAAAMRRIK